jgi:hypothetical protein
MVQEGETATWTKVYENVLLDATTYYYKVVGNHAYEIFEYPAQNAELVIAEAGYYTVTFTLVVGENPSLNANAVKYVAPAAPAAPVFTPAPGEDGKYTSEETINVTLSCETEGASILYSLNYGSDDEVFMNYEAGTPIVFDAEGEYVVAAKAVLAEVESEVVVVTYIIVTENMGTDVDNTQLVAMVYAKEGMVYVGTEVGNMIEVFTVQGQRIYASEATAQLTAIDALNADVVLVRVNGETVKVSVK